MKTAFNRVLEHTQPVRTETRPDGVHEHRRLDMSDYGDIREATMDVVTLRPADGSEPVHTITGRHASFYNGLRYDEDTQAHKVVKRTVDGRTREYAGASMVCRAGSSQRNVRNRGRVPGHHQRRSEVPERVAGHIPNLVADDGATFCDRGSGFRRSALTLKPVSGKNPKRRPTSSPTGASFWEPEPYRWSGMAGVRHRDSSPGRQGPCHEVTVEPFMTIEDFATRSF